MRTFSPTRAAVMTAIAVLATGFGVMALLAIAGRWDTKPGMWHYRAATWGDILLIPGICALLAAGLNDPRLPRRDGERGWLIAGGSLFGIAGALVQISWLAASDPVTNWTLPEPHTFSVPGWYHAAFLVATATGIGGAGFVLARRLRHASPVVRDQIASSGYAGGFVGAAIAFGAVLALDSVDSADTSAGQGSLAGALASVLTVIVLAAGVLGPKRCIRPLLAGVAVAALVVGSSVVTHGPTG